MIDQERFSKEEGNKVYRELSRILVEKYHAAPISSMEVGSWNSVLLIPVPGTNAERMVRIELTRISIGDWLYKKWSEARIRIGQKRWLKLQLGTEGWIIDQDKLFEKINQEILRVKGEWVAAQAEEVEMETNRSAIAVACGMDESLVEMRTPFVAKINMGWGYLVIGYDPIKPTALAFREIHISRHKDFRLSWTELARIRTALDFILGDKDE